MQSVEQTEVEVALELFSNFKRCDPCVMALSEPEWLTRKNRIDARLRRTNPAWTIIAYREGLDAGSLDRHAVTEYPTSNGPADYALFVNSRLLGIIEAKKVGVGPQNVLEQARRYSRGATTGSGKPLA